MMCLMCSCPKMLNNWLELYHLIGKKLLNITAFIFEIIGSPYIQHVHQYYTLRSRISQLFIMSKY